MANNQASDLIEIAINEAIRMNEDYVEGDILIDWVVVAYVTHPNKNEGSAYPMFFSNGELPTHRAKGLLVTGLSELG